MNEMQTFVYSGAEVRTVQKDGAPWFVLKDVCVGCWALEMYLMFMRVLTQMKRGSVKSIPLADVKA